MNTVVIKSAHDSSQLELSDFRSEYPNAESSIFTVTAKLQNCHATLQASTFETLALTAFFNDIAANWRGWLGEKKWSTLEGEFTLLATSDKTGHVELRFELSPPFAGQRWFLKGVLVLEAGSLDRVASDIASVWPNG